MDLSLKDALKARFEGDEPALIPIEVFFKGNDDPSSIGCNLLEHPGIEVFRRILLGLNHRDDVEAVFAQISEMDPGADSWPFTDTIWVAGTIPQEELAKILAPLEPDEVMPGNELGASQEFLSQHGNRVLGAWWD
jgi:hypothetical protein